ncbi:MAG: tRNA guanosine(15) transglycosylase TgtA, partial [Thermoplasmata archaeon]|nr:tRNA guanosine(15) transglycosylase TgtA [Thermoplasmata archaeon]
MVITNAYIIHKHAELRSRVLKDGLHKLLEFQGPIMTDSGTFQTHVYGDLKIDPIEIIEFQRDIGSDIGTILDVFTEPDSTPEEAAEHIKTTLKRGQESIELIAAKDAPHTQMALAGTVQGGLHYDLRTRCAEELSKLDFAVHPIGGVVPLMERYRFHELVEVVLASKMGLTPARPVHLFGAGHPMLFPLAVALGCDLFDSASYSKFAHDNRMMFPDGTRRLEDMELSPCNCPVCNNYSLSELKNLEDKERVKELAKHNLYVSFTELKKVQEAIYEGTLWELVEQRCHAHPYLLEALAPFRKRDTKQYLERFEPLSRKRFLYLGNSSLHRPAVYRYEQRFFQRYRQPPLNVLIGFDLPADPEKTYSQYYKAEISKVQKVSNSHFMVASIFGPV